MSNLQNSDTDVSIAFASNVAAFNSLVTCQIPSGTCQIPSGYISGSMFANMPSPGSNFCLHILFHLVCLQVKRVWRKDNSTWI